MNLKLRHKLRKKYIIFNMLSRFRYHENIIINDENEFDKIDNFYFNIA